MPTLTREDGAIFTVANYRSNIAIGKASIMKGEMRFLAGQHGNNVCVVPINALEAEGVFSRDKGYPIGEMVWDYLKRPQSVLYCEALTKNNAGKALLVVVRDGRVFLDAVIEKEFLKDEFASLVAENIPMDIKIYGDVPVSDTSDNTHFAFPSELVKSFEDLDTSVFENVRPSKTFELVPAIDALKRAGVLPTNYMPLIIVAMVIIGFIAYSGYEFFTKEEVTILRQVVHVDPYSHYIQDLAQPTPLDQFAFVQDKMQSVYDISGWHPTKFVFVPPELRVTIEPDLVSDMRTLNVWSRITKTQVQLDTNKADLIFQSSLKARDRVTAIYNLTSVMSDVVDNIVANILFVKVNSGKLAEKGTYKSVTLQVELAEASPAILKVLGNIMYDKPVYMKAMKITVNDNGTYSGKIEFELVGN